MSADEKVMTPEDSKQEVTEAKFDGAVSDQSTFCLLYTSPSPRD